MLIKTPTSIKNRIVETINRTHLRTRLMEDSATVSWKSDHENITDFSTAL